MKKQTIFTVIIVVVSIVGGYFLGNVLPFDKFFTGSNNNSSISQESDIPNNQGRLVVKVQNTDNEPIVGIEIDVAVQPGPPEAWGVKEADVQGMAKYDLEPGSYYVFFNMNRFPSEYVVQPEKQVTIVAGQQQEIIFVLEKK